MSVINKFSSKIYGKTYFGKIIISINDWEQAQYAAAFD